MENPKELPRDSRFFKGLAKKMFAIGISGLITGGYVVWPSVTQYFHDLKTAIELGHVSPTEAISLLCCVGPAVLGFGLLYKGVRKVKRSPPWDR